MVLGKDIADMLVGEAVRQIRMRPYLSELEIADGTVATWKDLIAEKSISRDSPLSRVEFNKEDYRVDQKLGKALTLYLRAVVNGKAIETYYQNLASMNEETKRYFGNFSTEYEFDQMLQNEQVRKIIAGAAEACPFSLLYRLNDDNYQISGSGHRKRRPLLVCVGATDEEIETLMKVEEKSVHNWGYSDYVPDDGKARLKLVESWKKKTKRKK